jgi:uncharacterized membrane protein YkoI
LLKTLGAFFGACHEPTLKGTFIGRSESDIDNPCVIAPALSPNNPQRTAPRALVAGAVALLLVCTTGAAASDQRDQERARAAVQAGEVLPLATLLERLQRTHPGQVLELELERDGGRWIYEVKLLQSGGQLLKLEVDGATGQVLDAKRKRSGKPERPEKPKLADDASK